MGVLLSRDIGQDALDFKCALDTESVRSGSIEGDGLHVDAHRFYVSRLDAEAGRESKADAADSDSRSQQRAADAIEYESAHFGFLFLFSRRRYSA